MCGAKACISIIRGIMQYKMCVIMNFNTHLSSASVIVGVLNTCKSKLLHKCHHVM